MFPIAITVPSLLMAISVPHALFSVVSCGTPCIVVPLGFHVLVIASYSKTYTRPPGLPSVSPDTSGTPTAIMAPSPLIAIVIPLVFANSKSEVGFSWFPSCSHSPFVTFHSNTMASPGLRAHATRDPSLFIVMSAMVFHTASALPRVIQSLPSHS